MFINTVPEHRRLPSYHKKFFMKRSGYVSRPRAQIFKDRRLFFSFYCQKRIFKGKSYPENVIEFYRIKKKFNCYLIEDACHALGAKYIYKKKNIYIGSCKHSDIAVFSMHPVKSITSGEGGFFTTNNK